MTINEPAVVDQAHYQLEHERALLHVRKVCADRGLVDLELDVAQLDKTIDHMEEGIASWGGFHCDAELAWLHVFRELKAQQLARSAFTGAAPAQLAASVRSSAPADPSELPSAQGRA